MPRSDLQFRDDVVAVAGLKRTDNLLVIGENVKFPGIRACVRSIKGVGTANELASLIKKGEKFERVFIAREMVLDERVVLIASQLVTNEGLICFFSEDAGLREAFCECIGRHFPTADVWPLSSNVGELVATNARAW